MGKPKVVGKICQSRQEKQAQPAAEFDVVRAPPTPPPRCWDSWFGIGHMFQQLANPSPLVIMMTTRVTTEATMKVEYKQFLFCRLVELKEKDDRHEKKIAARNLDSRRSHFFSRLSSPRARVTWRRGITRSLR